MENTIETTTGAGNLSAVRLTELETKALRVLFDSADGNGHDFGFIESLTKTNIMGKDQFSGVLSSLVKKGIIDEWGTWNVNGVTPRTQFTWGKQCGFGPNVNEGWERLPESFSQFCTMFNLLPALVEFEGLRHGV